MVFIDFEHAAGDVIPTVSVSVYMCCRRHAIMQGCISEQLNETIRSGVHIILRDEESGFAVADRVFRTTAKCADCGQPGGVRFKVNQPKPFKLTTRVDGRERED